MNSLNTTVSASVSLPYELLHTLFAADDGIATALLFAMSKVLEYSVFEN